MLARSLAQPDSLRDFGFGFGTAMSMSKVLAPSPDEHAFQSWMK